MIPKSVFRKNHVLTVSEYTRADLHTLFEMAQEMKLAVEKHGGLSILKGRILCTAFYEPSTRTSSSFEAAMIRLGGGVISINQITSSIAKGESVEDTSKFILFLFIQVRTLSSYGDAIVMRHPEKQRYINNHLLNYKSVQNASRHSSIPVINAGDGSGEHPTQAFLDIFTIREELGSVNGLTITIVGDLKNGRTVHSLVKLLSLYDVKINFVSPPSLALPKDILNFAIGSGLKVFETDDLNAITESTDVKNNFLFIISRYCT